MPLFIWLLGIVGPLAKKVLFSLGIGIVTYKGLTLVVDQARDAIIASWGQLGASTLGLLGLSGVAEAFGIALSALAYRAALLAVGHLAKIGE